MQSFKVNETPMVGSKSRKKTTISAGVLVTTVVFAQHLHSVDVKTEMQDNTAHFETIFLIQEEQVLFIIIHVPISC